MSFPDLLNGNRSRKKCEETSKVAAKRPSLFAKASSKLRNNKFKQKIKANFYTDEELDQLIEECKVIEDQEKEIFKAVIIM